MSISVSSKLILDGLFFHSDTKNPKSYIGKPASNFFFTPTQDSSGNVGFAVNGDGTFKRISSGNYGGYQIQPTDVVYRYDLGSTGCHYHGNDYNIPSGNTVTFSFDFYVSPGAGSYPVVDYLANIENGGNGLNAATGDPSPTILGTWKRISMTAAGTSNGSGFSRFLLYPGGCSSSRLATSGFILFKNAQVETGTFSTAYIPSGASVSGSRSATGSLVDIVGGYATNVTNAAFDASGQLTYNGSSAFVTIPTLSPFGLGNSPRSYFAWIKYSGGSYCILSTGTAANSQAFNLVTYGGSNKIGVMGYNNDFYPSSGATISDNKWHYVGATFNGVNSLKTYVDGRLDNSTTLTYTTIGQNNYIGKSNHAGADNYFNGSIGAVHMYNRELSASEILSNFNAGKGAFGL